MVGAIHADWRMGPDLGGGPRAAFHGRQGQGGFDRRLEYRSRVEGGSNELIPAAVIECIEVGT